MQGKASKKIVLQHISAIEKADVDILFDQALEFLWKYSHCHAIRLNLFHVKYPDGSIKADPEIKAILKLKKFKWKTVVNDVNGRSELLEVLNTAFQGQLDKNTAQIYRENLSLNDVCKEPLTVKFKTIMVIGSTKNPDKNKMMTNCQP